MTLNWHYCGIIGRRFHPCSRFPTTDVVFQWVDCWSWLYRYVVLVQALFRFRNASLLSLSCCPVVFSGAWQSTSSMGPNPRNFRLEPPLRIVQREPFSQCCLNKQAVRVATQYAPTPASLTIICCKYENRQRLQSHWIR